jgi:hypothetical protein
MAYRCKPCTRVRWENVSHHGAASCRILLSVEALINADLLARLGWADRADEFSFLPLLAAPMVV